MPGLEDLRKKLLFNSTLDIWIALCEEKRWEWFDLESYQKFLQFLEQQKILMLNVAVIDEPGRKGEFVQLALSKLGRMLSIFNVKLDSSSISKIREFAR